jgi:hypothetical protein
MRQEWIGGYDSQGKHLGTSHSLLTKSVRGAPATTSAGKVESQGRWSGLSEHAVREDKSTPERGVRCGRRGLEVTIRRESIWEISHSFLTKSVRGAPATTSEIYFRSA